MPWVKIDEHFYDHPKWASAPGDSVALWLAAMAWCNRNDSRDGFIPAVKLHGLVHIRNVRKTAADLEQRGAFHTSSLAGVDGYLIHDYVEFQQPEKVRQIAEKRSVAGREGARRRWQSPHPSQPPPVANGMANATANDVATRCPVNRQPSTEVVTAVRESSVLHAVPNPVDDDDFATALEIVVEAKVTAQRARQHITNPKAYRTRVRTNTIAEDGELIRRMLADGTPIEQTAMFVLGHGLGAEQEHRVDPDRWCTTTCELCHGDHWIDDGTDRPAPCPNGPRATG